MEKLVIFIFLIISMLTAAQIPQIKIQNKVLQYIPQIRKEYSVTYTQIYPPQIHQAELHKQHKQKTVNTQTITVNQRQKVSMENNLKLNPLRDNINQIINNNFQRQNPMPQPIAQPLPQKSQNPQTPTPTQNQNPTPIQNLPQTPNSQPAQVPQPTPVPTPIPTPIQTPNIQTNQAIPKSTPQKEQQPQKNKVSFEQFHKIQFKSTKKYIVYNIDDRSVLNSQGNIIQLQKKQTPPTLSISIEKQKQQQKQPSIIDKIIQTFKPTTPIQPTPSIQPIQQIQPQLRKQQKPIQPPINLNISPPSISTEKEKQNIKKQYNINKILQPIKNDQDLTAKLLFTIMLGISILVIVFGYKPDPQKRRPAYIPRNDDEESSLN